MLQPIAPIKGTEAAPEVAAVTPDGLKIYSNANIFRDKVDKGPDIVHGKYGDLGLFEEGPTVNGVRTLRYKEGAKRPYNDQAIKENILPYYKEQNPGVKLRFEFGGELPLPDQTNPVAPIV